MKRERECVVVGLVKNVPFADVLPINQGRNELVEGLLKVLGLSDMCETIEFASCRASNLEMFHDDDYVRALERAAPDSRFSLEFDAHPFPNLFEHCKSVAGATLSAAAWLARPGLVDEKRIAINWTGGRHHARSSSASGWCFVNDVVLGMLLFRRRKIAKLAYFDMDVHAGDAVEEACGLMQKDSLNCFDCCSFFCKTLTSCTRARICSRLDSSLIRLVVETRRMCTIFR